MMLFADGKKRNTIPEDTWNVTLDFVNQISDFEQYDTEGAWPTLLDEFVEYAKLRQAAAAASNSNPTSTSSALGPNGEEQMQVD